MNILSIIPARGGSKGIPLKNLAYVGGRSLIDWSISASLGSDRITRTIVSTDHEDIARISESLGAEFIRRPVDLSSDQAKSEEALIHTLKELEKRENYTPDLVVFLQCTSPLTTSEDIDACINILLSEQADSAFTSTAFYHFLWQEENGLALGINHSASERKRRQDIPSQFLENGAVYVMRTPGFLTSKHRFFGKVVTSPMPESRSFEIDEPIHLEMADVLLRKRHQTFKVEYLPATIDCVFLDFDGVFTDNKVSVSEDGHESVTCDRGDGMGISMLKQAGIPVIVLSTETNPVVEQRCKKLGIECHASLGLKKHEKMLEICDKNDLETRNIVFVGNDVNDIGCLIDAYCAVVPKDAHVSVRKYAQIILESEGGDGAIREISDLILSRQK